MLAEHDEPTSLEWAIRNRISLADTVRKADLELGRILDRLETRGLEKETVILITADHGGQHSRYFHGRREPGAHLDNLMYGSGAGFDRTTRYPPALDALFRSGKVQVASMNTLLLVWSAPMNETDQQEVVDILSRTAGVAEVFRKSCGGDSTSYQRVYRSPDLNGRELDWAEENNPALTMTLASETGPEFIGLLFDDHGYDVSGSHGGAQEKVQRIPYLVIAPNLKGGLVSDAKPRLVDVNLSDSSR